MKTQNIFSIGIIFVLSLMLTSCGTSIDIAKRHFNDGYYVHISKKKEVQHAERNQDASSKEQDMPSEVAVQSEPEISSSEKNDATSDNLLTASADDKPEIILKKNTPKVEEISNQVPETKLAEIAKKKIRNKLFPHRQNHSFGQSGVPGIIMVILCIFIPPFAIYLEDGIRTPFWVDLLIWVIGLGILSATKTGYVGLLVLIAIIYAFTVCF